MMITDYLIDVPLNGHLAKFNNKKSGMVNYHAIFIT